MNEKRKMKSEIGGEQMTDLARKDVKPMSGPETKTFWSKISSKIIIDVTHMNKFLNMNEQIFLCVH